MEYLAPIPILFGGLAVLAGLLWLISVGSEEDGGPSTGMFWAFGMTYIMFRAIGKLAEDPMSVLPAFGLLIGGGGLIWLDVVML